MVVILQMPFSISFLVWKLLCFYCIKSHLRLKQNGHHIAGDSFQLIILVWVLLYFAKSHSDAKTKMAAILHMTGCFGC